jgi:citrate/tricarballylate utilization protein
MRETSLLAEAERLMTVCNSCRYCEGLCAVFPAMEMRRAFPAGDLRYLANLCHGCGACYVDCQFAPPHEFDVNVPRVLAQLRAESYEAYAWPRALAGLFRRNGLWVSLLAALSVALFIVGFVAFNDPGAVFAVHTGPGAFYRLMPHNAMVAVFGIAFLYALVALAMGLRAFRRDIAAAAAEPRSFRQALKDAARLRYLDGGGVGCFNEDERPTDRRRFYHHLAFYGFLLCFASTSVATGYHYVVGREAPYLWYDLPVVLGTLGGFGLVIGPAGLLAAKWRRHPDMQDETRFGMDTAFIAMLFLTGATGLVLLLLRATPAMGMLLAVHLGVVFGFFISLPYGKFVHGLYRFAALVHYAEERRKELSL